MFDLVTSRTFFFFCSSSSLLTLFGIFSKYFLFASTFVEFFLAKVCHISWWFGFPSFKCPISTTTSTMYQNEYNLFWGLKLPDNRFNNYHIIDYSHTWDDNVTKFPGPQNSFGFERAFIPIGNYLQELTLTKWHYSFYISLVYMVVIFGIQRVMRDRKPFKLQIPLIGWNLLLALFSAVGVYRCLPEFVHILRTEGVEASFSKSTYYNDFRPTVWYLFFTLSKSFELIDTLFIVLRKSKLIPLHWVHHVLTLCFSWFVFSDVPGTARWMVNMNFAVHTLMYFYYALKAMKFHISRRISLTITTLQVLQMFAGLYINFQSVSLKLRGMPADISYSVAGTGLALYGIFAVLFLKFFFSTYVISKIPMQAVFSDINHNHYKGFVKKLQ